MYVLSDARREDIRKDPVFRAQFHTMCANIGVDPLASNKGVWAQVLGFGDFYYELGVQIVEACLASRSLNGGLMDMHSLMRYVAVRPANLNHHALRLAPAQSFSTSFFCCMHTAFLDQEQRKEALHSKELLQSFSIAHAKHGCAKAKQAHS